MSILIVDDTPDNILLLKSMLKREGYENLYLAESGQEVIDLLGMSGNAAQVTDLDLILLDIMMPEISGIDLCMKIKTQPEFADIPIIMVTARTDMEALEEAFAAGAMDYVTKPINKVELFARMRSALKLRHEMQTRKKKTEELQKALDEIHTLRGLIPVCAYCKAIRDDAGAWSQMEVYIQKNSEAEFSHGICPQCEAKMTKQLEEREKRKRESGQSE